MAAEQKVYHLTGTPGHVAAQFNRHGKCATVKVDIVVLGKFQAACASKITVELTTFLFCIKFLQIKWNITGQRVCRYFFLQPVTKMLLLC